MFRRKKDYHEFKPLLVEIEDEPLNPLGRIIFWTIIAALFFFSCWMIIGKVDVVVSARGKVIPDGEIKVLQPLTSGTVSSILTKEGDYIEKGQVLMEIDPSSTEPELESMKNNLKQLQLEIARIRSTLEGTTFAPDTSLYGENLIKVQKDLYYSSIERAREQLLIKDKQLNEINAQLAALKKTKEQYKYLTDTGQERLKRLESVKDIISRDEYEQAERDFKNNQSSLASTVHRIVEFQATKDRVNTEKNLIKEEEQNKLLTELATKSKELEYLEASIKKSSYINAKQQIVSPVNGYVNKLAMHTIGGVVTPAEELIVVVPDNTKMVIKALVLNKDIGFINKDMDVSIKIDTFSFQKYGILNGLVKQVGRDSIEDQNMGLVYEIYVDPLQLSLMVDGVKTSISTGMSVTTEINVGKRRIIEFFIYPLIKYLDEGISVR